MTEQQRQQLEAIQKQIGDRGEDFVLRYERQRLHAHPRVSDISLIGRCDVGIGYDILSFKGVTSKYPDRYIEVKTYSGKPHFFLSASEQAAATKYGDCYFIYLIDINKTNISGYEPIIIQNPVRNLAGGWQETVQSKEFTYVEKDLSLPEDIDDSTILVGCYNSNEHLLWIQNKHAYNVRQGFINGNILSDEMTNNVRYLLLYASPSPRTYRLYSVKETREVTRQDMLRMGYPHPHAERYLLYHITGEVAAPPLDIMQILRTYNDKLKRTSGTPIYLSGKQLKSYLLNAPKQNGTSTMRLYTNEGKPWSQVQQAQLAALYQTGTAIDALAHKLKRTTQEIKAQLIAQGLLPNT